MKHFGIFCAFASVLALAPSVGFPAEPVRLDTPAPSDFAQYGATAESVSYATLPDSWIVDDWHRLGVKVYVRLAPEPNETPERFRRRFGLHVFRSGVDSVSFSGSEEDRAFFASAMKAAADDVALVRKLDELAQKAQDSDDAVKRTAGREAKVYVHISANFGDAPTALVRRELVLRIRRLQEVMGEAPMAMPADIPDDPPRPFIPPRDVRTVKVPGPYEYVSVFSNVTFRASGHGFCFSVSDGRSLRANTWPGVKREFTLYIQGTNRNDWLVYELACDLTDRKPASGANVKSAPRVQFYTLEPRFGAVAGPRFVTKTMHLPSRARPGLKLGYTYEAPILLHAGSSGPWCFDFAYDWPQIYGLIPNNKTVWYIREGDDWARIEWHVVDAFGGLSFRDFVGNYKKTVENELGEWGYNDPLFRDACVRPLVDANAELLAMLSKRVEPNGYISWNGADKFTFKKASENANKMGFFLYDVQEARIRYLDDVMAGREIKIPERKVKVEKKIEGPSLDEATGFDIELDDSEY